VSGRDHADAVLFSPQSARTLGSGNAQAEHAIITAVMIGTSSKCHGGSISVPRLKTVHDLLIPKCVCICSNALSLMTTALALNTCGIPCSMLDRAAVRLGNKSLGCGHCRSQWICFFPCGPSQSSRPTHCPVNKVIFVVCECLSSQELWRLWNHLP
jgi:hypothetical protein